MLKRFDFTWFFPLPRVHTGLLLGNGRLGAMIWGEQSTLKITLGRADWWDHRGGKSWTAEMNYRDIRRCLESQDAEGIRTLFAEPDDGGPRRPSLIPVGRFELKFASEVRLVKGVLDRFGAVVRIDAEYRGRTHPIELEMCMDCPLMQVRIPPELDGFQILALPGYDTAGDSLKKRGIEPPVPIRGDGIIGFKQALPQDPSLTAVANKVENNLWIRATLEHEKWSKDVAEPLDESVLDFSRRWWKQYWAKTPKVCLPNEKLQFLYDYGVYKFAGLTCPLGAPSGLQGPWIEDYTTPPWSGDYHFNINVQMCYGPAYPTGHLAHLKPLFDLIESWMPQLREHARLFIGIDDGVMLPHSVDDRCRINGSFWTGTVDHGCTAWVGKMMYDYWQFGGADDEWARKVMYPFLKGTMRVYEAMLERDADRFVLPVSVSPEYRGASMNAWGKNASFQLACIHMLCEWLIELSSRFGENPNPMWQEILEKLPRACVEEGKICLWQGTPLEESHRHHSHLAGITPFDVIDPRDPEWEPVIKRSFAEWIMRGMGLWSGWCMSWAVQLHTRVGNAEMSELLIEIWEKVFTNQGHGTLHDCEFPGFTLMGSGPTGRLPNRNEIMQMDAGMGMVNAITDMLCYRQREVHYFFRGCPSHWDDVSFEGIHVGRGFVVSGRRHKSEGRVDVRSDKGGVFRYADFSGQYHQVEFKPGESKTIRLS